MASSNKVRFELDESDLIELRIAATQRALEVLHQADSILTRLGIPLEHRIVPCVRDNNGDGDCELCARWDGDPKGEVPRCRRG